MTYFIHLTVYLIKTPIIPLITFLNIAINIYLMLALSSATWIRFAVWLAIGKFNLIIQSYQL